MSKSKKVFLGILGGVFLLSGLYYRLYDPGKGIPYEYMGIGTWVAGIVFYTLFPKYKEIVSLVVGLLVLHAGVLLLLKESYPDPGLLGALVFTAGVIMVLSSGFSDYMKRKRSER